MEPQGYNIFALVTQIHHVLLVFSELFHQHITVLSLLTCFPPEVAKYYGSDANSKTIQNVWGRQVKAAVNKLNATVAQGGDPKDIPITDLWATGNGSISGDLFSAHSTISLCSFNSDSACLVVLLLISSTTEIARCYGTHATPRGVRAHFERDIKPSHKEFAGEPFQT